MPRMRQTVTVSSRGVKVKVRIRIRVRVGLRACEGSASPFASSTRHIPRMFRTLFQDLGVV